MVQTRDSFLHFLADNLQPIIVNNKTVNTPIKNIRRQVNSPDSEQLGMNTINVKFLNADYDMFVSQLTVSIDVVYEDELECVAVTEAVFNLLRQSAYTFKLDYTDPNNPIDVGYKIFWEPNIRFKPIHSMMYTHYNARLVLNQHQQ